jgi:hypothetical protein
MPIIFGSAALGRLRGCEMRLGAWPLVLVSVALVEEEKRLSWQAHTLWNVSTTSGCSKKAPPKGKLMPGAVILNFPACRTISQRNSSL